MVGPRTYSWLRFEPHHSRESLILKILVSAIKIYTSENELIIQRNPFDPPRSLPVSSVLPATRVEYGKWIPEAEDVCSNKFGD